MLPAPVDKRHEFVSPGWIDAARSFLTGFVESHPQLREANYAMCEAFDDAPPKLAGSGGRVAWFWRLRNGALDVGAGDIADANLNIRGDYQHVLSMAQGVNAAGED